MHKSIVNLAVVIGLVTLGFAQTAFAGQQTTRTGPQGNSQVTNRSYSNGKQTTTRTGPQGKTQTTNRSFSH